MKRMTAMICLLLLLLLLNACSIADTAEPFPSPSSFPPNDVSATETAEAGGNDDEPMTQINHVTRDLGNSISVDAEVINGAKGQLSVYTALPSVYTSAFLSDVFFSDDTSSQTVAYYEDDANGFILVTERGNELYVNSVAVSYNSPSHQSDIEIADIMRRYSERAENADDNELGFLARERAIENAVALFDKLQVFGTPDIRCFTAMTHDKIAAYQTDLMNDASYAEFVEIGKTKLLDSLTAADDAYYLRFSFTAGGIPILDTEYEQPLKSAADDFYNRSLGAEMLITASGIRYFTMSGPFSSDVKEASSQKAISADEALNLFEEKYELQIVSEPIIITKVYLEYLPINQRRQSGEVSFTPYWCLEYSLSGRGDSPRLAGAERFNAITGKDYAYGG